MSARPEPVVMITSIVETVVWGLAGLWMTKNKQYE